MTGARWIAAALALAVPGAGGAAERPAAAAHDPAEIAAIGRVLDDVYAVISGPAGKPRDWDAMRALFTSGARLESIGPNGVRGGDLDHYIATSGPQLVASGFTERELVRRVEIFGSLAQAWSSYEGNFTANGEQRRIRGVNSFQLVRNGDGSWKVHSILWQAERPGLSVPEDMMRADEKGSK